MTNVMRNSSPRILVVAGTKIFSAREIFQDGHNYVGYKFELGPGFQHNCLDIVERDVGERIVKVLTTSRSARWDEAVKSVPHWRNRVCLATVFNLIASNTGRDIVGKAPDVNFNVQTLGFAGHVFVSSQGPKEWFIDAEPTKLVTSEGFLNPRTIFVAPTCCKAMENLRWGIQAIRSLFSARRESKQEMSSV